MPLVIKDRVQETTTTTGTGTITLAGAVSGFQSFSVIGDGNTTFYSIVGGTQWELGIGTYTSSGTTLSRDTILESSNSGSAVDLVAGTKSVFCTYPAERSVYVDGSSITPGASATLPVSSGGTGSSTAAFSGENITSLNASSFSSGTLAVARGGTGQTSLTANNVILGNGTSAVQFVAPGTNGNVLTSNGTTWTSAAAAGGGGSFVYLASATASSSVVDFTGLDTSTYFAFLIMFTDLRAAGLAVRLYPGGTLSTAGIYGYGFQALGTAESTTVFTYGSTFTILDQQTATTANLGRSGYLYFYPAGGYSCVDYQATAITGTNNGVYCNGFGYINNATTANGIRFGTGNMGNLTAGNFRLYGVKNS